MESDLVDEFEEGIVLNDSAYNRRLEAKAASFSINGKRYEVSSLPGNTTLNQFIRGHAHLLGTKYMCQEGGCGACVVAVTAYDVISKKPKVFAVNSCLVPVYKCHGWSIKTVEGVGNARAGYHEIQARLASNYGTQCGYCSQ
ncbi:hypothetical protein LSTR_LSTR008945 [Laodelphax striatellus]|uniref:2Fe-2S ferredoxin-type domain-containing protein n=1 Tax=Laodelphax striatellus TaxID=195883 RepID=A0A482WQE8_LAOST|nr:hypothetical protein LSTR_LSTR008945 [Laodelphax striatellus]